MSSALSPKKTDSPYQVQVLDRALAIMEALATNGPELGLIELADLLALHKSTVHRLVVVLERHRFIERNPRNGKYRLGLKLFELGSKAVASLDLGERVRPYLERLVLQTGETAHLCILDRGEMLSLANVESPQAIRPPATVGRRTPIHCTSVGKAVLAFLDDRALDALLADYEFKAFTRNTIVGPQRLKAELALVRERGYAVDDEEIELGLRCIGAPVRTHSGQVVASMSVAGPAYRLIPEKISVIGKFVAEVANQFSQELGFRGAELFNDAD